MNNKKLLILLLKNIKDLYPYGNRIDSIYFLVKFSLGPIMLIVHECFHVLFCFLTLSNFKIRIYNFMKVQGYHILFNVVVSTEHNKSSISKNISRLLISSGPLWIILFMPYIFGIKGLIILYFTFEYWFLTDKDISIIKESTDNLLQIFYKYFIHFK